MVWAPGLGIDEHFFTRKKGFATTFVDLSVESGTNLYSLIQTAKANHLEPYQYLRHVFTELPKAQTVDAIEALLPANIDVNTIYC